MLRILHLSDLHFGQIAASAKTSGKQVSAHRFADEERPIPGALADILLRNVVPPPDVVIVSGDVGWAGVKEDYEYARSFLEILRDKWTGVAFVVAPGNHDVDCLRTNDKQDAFVEFLRAFHVADFDKQYSLLKTTTPTDRQTLTAVHHVKSPSGSDDMLIVAVNSAANIETKDGVPVFVMPATLQAIEDKIRALKIPSRTLRIFTLHHHLFPFAEKQRGNVTNPTVAKEQLDSSLVWNSAKLQEWLAENSFHIILHGHKHLSHGRDDVLWRRASNGAQEGQRVFVVGAGSAGVEENHREPGEPLSYNLLSVARLSDERWNVDVSVRYVEEGKAVTKGAPLYAYEAAVGKVSAGKPSIFQAERMDDCHAAIQRTCESDRVISSFMSVVEDSSYIHPSTVRIGQDKIDEDRIKSSFLLLHPEYEDTNEWTDVSKIDDALQKIKPRFRFSHGQRLFGHPERKSIPQDKEQLWETRPILRAVKSLDSARPSSKAYVGLYNPEIDALSRDEPLPGLMSIQFVRDSSYLDVVATFRKIELSFWWVVNMYELGKLLRWAAKARTMKLSPRRITFFAALAEWSPDPEPAVVAALDAMELGALAALAQDIHNGKASNASKSKLKELLVDKKNHTSDTNLDPQGLSSISRLIEGLRPKSAKSGSNTVHADLSKKLAVAEGHIRVAMKAGSLDREADVTSAKKALEEAIAFLA